MSAIWDKICEMFTRLVPTSRRKKLISFSPSTLHREILRNSKLSASPNPFFNFLAEMRMKMSSENVRITKAAGRLWNSMSEEQKLPYRNIALKQRKLKRSRRRRRSALSARRRKKRKTPVPGGFIYPTPHQKYSQKHVRSTSTTAVNSGGDDDDEDEDDEDENEDNSNICNG